MASGIPTRRTTRRVDENAPPAAGTIATRSRSTASTNGGALAAAKASTASTTSIPVMKRTMSAATTRSTLRDDGLGKPDAAATKRRNALGEVTNGGKNADGNKSTGVKDERKPLATTQASQAAAQRPARSTASTTSGAVNVKDEKVIGKRKAVVQPPSKIPSRSRSTTASTSTTVTAPETKPLKERKPNVDDEPSRKRRKTSTPPPGILEDQEGRDLVDEAHYDVDGREILLSSGSQQAVGLRSPKRKAKDEGWTDLDAEDEGNPTMVSEYVVDAFNYMLAIEKQTMASPDYMDKQDELQWKMRAILMDWLIEVHGKFRLLPETLFIATNLVDRFLSHRLVSLVKLQLVGLTALFVAAKYEEVICPSIEHFLHMTDGGYTTDEILKAERYMLSTLGFDLSYPNPLHFLRRISKADGYDIQTRTVAKYLVEISCVDHRLIKYPSSLLAAAAMWLGRLCLDRGEWTPNLVHYSTYSQDELLECAQVMLDFILDADFNDTSSFYKKYASKKHMKASVYVREWATGFWPETASGQGTIAGMELALHLAGEE
ncbi:hypothetical protein IAR55_005249 [Kwoniella newhampshirensis]|uniref:G2/mitotic-specific cyclin 1/2 n=1 Tax=Kwoniella newhampshirensis TaxID=1651941 RepID=A0AAW0YKE0_9TREE